MTPEDPNNNPFIRWKQLVDAHVAATLQGIVGLPSVVSRNVNTRWNGEPTAAKAVPDSQALPSPPQAAEMDGLLTDWLDVFWANYTVQHSRYSPLNLRLLPPPVPRGAPVSKDADGGGAAFTFEDAFEDLLAASSGREMMDLGARHEMRKLLRQMFPEGEPAFFWLQRLKSQGLLDLSSARPGGTEHGSLDGWPAFEKQWDLTTRPGPWPEPEAAEQISNRETPGKPEVADRHSRPPALFGELDRLFRAATEDRAKNSSGEDKPPQPGKEADAFDELYSAIDSAFHESGKSLTTLFKMIGDVAADARPTTWTTRDGLPNQISSSSGKLERVESTESHVDSFGYRHMKKVVRTLNESGKEVGRETEYSVRPAEPSETNQSDNALRDAGEDTAGGGRMDKEQGKRGWFWK